MKKNVILSSFFTAAMLPAAVVSADTNLSYSYAEVGYTDRDFGADTADGLLLNGSLELTDTVFVFAGYSDLSGNVDTSTLNFGVGVAAALTDMVDGYAKVAHISNDTGPVDDDGLGIEVGLRSMVAQQVELFGNLQYVDIYDDSESAIEVGGRYWHMSNLAFSASYIDGDLTGSGLTLAARFGF